MKMTTETQNRSARSTALGIILGLSAVLLIFSVIYLFLRIYFIIYGIAFSLGLVIIVPVWLGITLGIDLVRKKFTRELSWPIIILLALLLLPASVTLPFGVKMLYLSHNAHAAITEFPGARLITTKFLLGDGINTGDRVSLKFSARTDASKIVEFYRTQLGYRGWKEGPQRFIEEKLYGTPYWFKKNGKFIHIKFEALREDQELTFYVVYGI